VIDRGEAERAYAFSLPVLLSMKAVCHASRKRYRCICDPRVRSSMRPKGLPKQLMIAAGRRLVVPWASSRVVVLCYHSVHATDPTASATPELFGRHLRWLREHCEVTPFRRVMDVVHDRPASRPAVAITFDDGYADNFECAFPVLNQYGLSATFFLTVPDGRIRGAASRSRRPHGRPPRRPTC